MGFLCSNSYQKPELYRWWPLSPVSTEPTPMTETLGRRWPSVRHQERPGTPPRGTQCLVEPDHALPALISGTVARAFPTWPLQPHTGPAKPPWSKPGFPRWPLAAARVCPEAAEKSCPRDGWTVLPASQVERGWLPSFAPFPASSCDQNTRPVCGSGTWVPIRHEPQVSARHMLCACSLCTA